MRLPRPSPFLVLTTMSLARAAVAFLSSSSALSSGSFVRAAVVGNKAGSLSRQTCAAAMSSAVDAGKLSEASVRTSYEELCKALREIDAIEGVMGLLGWDEQVMMPPGAAASRAKMKAATAGILHEKRTHAKLSGLIDTLSSSQALSLLKDDYERANLRMAKKDRDIQARKSKELASKEAELEAKGYQTWVAARQDDKWEDFAPVLTEILDLKKEVAQVTHPNVPPYDANIDPFEPNMSAERLESIFSAVRKELVPLLHDVVASPAMKKEIPAPLKGGDDWGVEAQVALCKQISSAIGFDYDKGRMDTSVHPFTGGSHPTDVRITTRYSKDNWLEGIAGTVHEVGHALYEQGRSPEQDGLPVSKALGMGVHESQSLLWERMVFQGLPFWKWVTPLFHQHFPHTRDMTPMDFYGIVNRVEPGLIRVDADELTYPLHIILRFELERALFQGSVSVPQLPQVWKDKMKTMLGVEVPSDKVGVLQDVHWACGAIGYFPSYSLGAMTAAQLYAQACKEMPTLEEDLSQGKFTPLREWLREKVHRVGSLHESCDDLLRAVTGEPLRPEVYVEYLRKKYTALAAGQ